MQVYRALQQLLLLATLLLVSSCSANAQNQRNSNAFTEAELDQMLAPVALYPDSVLTHLLIAATYPLEVVQATRWVEQHPGLSGDEAVEAVSDQDWDPSVQALVAFPQLLKRLNDDLSWTQQLGEAFISDETALLASIQRLRQRAYAHGSLRNTEHIVVEREREVIVIEPARREVVYVPYYDTRVVYGNWWWPAYPPVYWYEPAGYRSSLTFYWGSGFRIRPSFYFGIFDWHQRHVVVHHHYYHKPPRYYPRRQHFQHATRWQHDHYHRRGVHYQHSALRDKQDFYHSRPEQRRVHADRSQAHQRDWRTEREQRRELQPERQAHAERPRYDGQRPQREHAERQQPDQHVERQQREAQFSQLQRRVQAQERQLQAQQQAQMPQQQRERHVNQDRRERTVEQPQYARPEQRGHNDSARQMNRPQPEQRVQSIPRQQPERPQPEQRMQQRPQPEQRMQRAERSELRAARVDQQHMQQ